MEMLRRFQPRGRYAASCSKGPPNEKLRGRAFYDMWQVRCCFEIGNPVGLAPCHSKELARALDRLNVVYAATIPIRAAPTATRRGETTEEVGHRVVRTMSGDQVVA